MEQVNKLYFVLACLLSFIMPRKKLVYFSSFYGQYNDNPRRISEKLHELAPEIPIYWVKSSRNHVSFPNYIKTIDITSFKHYMYMFTAKVTIDNQIGMKTLYMADKWTHRIFLKIVNRSAKKQLNIGTWHGTPLKNIGEKCLGTIFNFVRTDTTDYSVAGCSLTEKCLLEAFPKAFEVKRYGTPRNDIFFITQNTSKIKRKLKLPEDKKILLFAPTFRNDLQLSGIIQLDTIDWVKVTEVLKSKFSGDWVVVVRIHPHVMEEIDINYNNLIINGNLGDDMADYLISADALITDYSSSFFDYALTKRPCFLYTPDLEQYRDRERGFYFDFNKLPFPNTDTPEQLINCIINFNFQQYSEDVEHFLRSIGNYEDGKASERVVHDILKVLTRPVRTICVL